MDNSAPMITFPERQGLISSQGKTKYDLVGQFLKNIASFQMKS